MGATILVPENNCKLAVVAENMLLVSIECRSCCRIIKFGLCVLVQVNIRTRDNTVHGTKSVSQLLLEFKEEASEFR